MKLRKFPQLPSCESRNIFAIITFVYVKIFDSGVQKIILIPATIVKSNILLSLSLTLFITFLCGNCEILKKKKKRMKALKNFSTFSKKKQS